MKMQCSVTQEERNQKASTNRYFQASEKNPLNASKNSESAGCFVVFPQIFGNFEGWVWFVLF